MSNTVAKIIVTDNLLDNINSPLDIDERFNVVVSDQTIYDNTSSTHARANFNYSLLKVRKPSQAIYTYGNVGADNFRYAPSLLPEDIIIEKPLMGIYKFSLYIVPDGVSGESYLADECIRFNNLFYKFTANATFTGVVSTSMSLITIEEVTANYKSELEFYSVIPIMQCLELKSETLFCKLKEDFNYPVCEDKAFSDIMVLLTPDREFKTPKITEENVEKYRDIFNYLSLSCNCPTC